MALNDMNSYDRSAWDEVERWRAARLSAAQRHVVPETVRERAAKLGKSAQGKFEDLPGTGQFLEAFRKALDGLLGLVGAAADASLRRDAIAAAYSKRGHDVKDLASIRELELRVVDKTKPRIGVHYTIASTAEGALAGFAVSGGEIVAAGGAVAGAGAGGAPGAGLIVTAMAADAVAVLAAMMRAIAHTAAYYGYDTELPEEHVFAAGVLSFGLAQQAGKSAAYIELNKIVQELARKAAWEQLHKNAAAQVVRVVYERLGMRLTKEKLGQAIPVVGVLFGAGANAWLLAHLTDDADRIYRERFLREKYGLPLPTPPAAPNPAASGQATIAITEIVDDEIGSTSV